MIRNILDYQGNIIGSMDLPESTTEAQWQEKLAKFTVNPNLISLPEVSPRQLRSAMLLSGITEQSVMDSIEMLPNPDKGLAEIAWKWSTSFTRDSEVVDMLGSMVGLSSEQLDNLWKFASTL
jgi:hypothetical protein